MRISALNGDPLPEFTGDEWTTQQGEPEPRQAKVGDRWKVEGGDTGVLVKTLKGWVQVG